MNTFIWIIQDSIIRSDLLEFQQKQDIEFHLYLSKPSKKFLTATQEAYFKTVHVAEDFEVDTVEQYIRSLNLESKNLHIVTNDEASELLCVDLQSRFYTPRFSRDTVETFTNKLIMKEKLRDTEVRVPRFSFFDKAQYAELGKAYCHDLAEKIGFPMIAKPIDKYASMDVKRINNIYELLAWSMWACGPTDEQNYELEEFIEGELFHCDSIFRDGEMIWSNVCENLNPCMDYMQGKAIGAGNIPNSSQASQDILKFNHQALAHLNPPDGVIHLECFRKNDGELVFLEVAARPPGGDVVGIYQYAFGFDIELIHLMLRSGVGVEIKQLIPNRYGAWISFPKEKGHIEEIRVPELACKTKMEINVEKGMNCEVEATNIVNGEAAVFWLYTEDYTNLEKDYALLKNHKLCEFNT
ncbi:acetyl-CoA carboxylase biotin carboxylase subunit family protein [Marinicella sp. W31]|uniref:ATP-grasp domain-containing protein n=1 Tax=Marinicella sp. W31 TaxID=3023713 RepID=UPI003756B516